MGVLDKLAFWKQDDDDFSSFEKELGGGDPLGGSDDLGSRSGRPGNTGMGGMDNGGFGRDDPKDMGPPGLMSTPPSATPSMSQPGMHDLNSNYGGYTQPPKEAPKGFGEHPPVETGYKEERIAKEMEVISSKLDTLKAMIESLNHRLVNIERVALDEENKGKRW